MARPVVSQAAEDLYVSLLPLAYADEQNDWPLLKYCEANAGRLQEVNDYIGNNGTPAWSTVVDVDRAPFKALPWLGQLAGQITPNQQLGESDAAYEDRLRAYIKGTPGFKRGSLPGMAAAVQQFLTGTKTVYFRERDTSAYHFAISTRKLETPVEDWASTNLITNGSFETNLSNEFTNFGTLTRDLTQFYHGIASAKIVATTNQINVGQTTANITGASAGRKFSGSFWIKGTPSSAGKFLALNLYEFGGATGEAPIPGGATTITLTENWQQIKAQGVPLVQNDRTSLRLYTFSAAGGGTWATGDTVYLDQLQVEENPLSTPYIHTDGAIASRPAGNGPVGVALQAQKPAGLVMVYSTIAGQDWQNVVNNYATWTAVASAYATIDLLENG